MGNGPNALDFHIAFYIGELSANDPNAYFHIISKDKGFDHLIQHLRKRKIRVQRSKDIGEIPLLRISDDKTKPDKITDIVKKLKLRGIHRPRKEQTLKNTINAMFLNTLKNEELIEFVVELKKQNYISIKDGKVTYNLKKSAN
jgi:hypothetical protein